MIRFLVIIGILLGVVAVVVYSMDGVRQQVVEAVSPASKEARLLNELSASLGILTEASAGSSSPSSPGGGTITAQEVQEQKAALETSQKLLEEITKLNNNRSPITDGGAHIIEVVKDIVKKSPEDQISGEETIEYKTAEGEKLICRPLQ